MLDFGVEIEFLAANQTQATVAAAVVAAGVPCIAAGYSHVTNRTSWKVVSDASIIGGLGFELVSPPLTEAGLGQIEKVCAVLATLHATVNRSCGLHVHIGARQHSVAALKKLAMLYIENEAVIDSLLPTSRRGNVNNYCQSVAQNVNMERLTAAQDITTIARSINDGQRFVKLNFTSYWRHGTVEFRHHSGSIEAAKIIKWIHLCSKLVEVAVATANEPLALRAAGAPASHSARWRRGRRWQILFRLMTRPEGVTTAEFSEALGIRGRNSLNWFITQAGEGRRTSERRNRLPVFRLDPPVQTTTIPPTLDSFSAKLGLTEEEKAFWSARAARLASQPMATV